MIESWWRQLKHQWLFLNQLDSVGSLRQLAGFYVEEHNTRLPHSAFRGQTPDEMYFGTGGHVPGDLDAKRKAAIAARMAANRARSCRVCRESVSTEAESPEWSIDGEERFSYPSSKYVCGAALTSRSLDCGATVPRTRDLGGDARPFGPYDDGVP